MLDRACFNRLALTTALKGGFALTLAASIALYFHYDLFWWAIFVCFLSIQVDIGSSLMMLAARFGGTLLGALCATIISLLYQYPWIYYPSVFMFMFAGLYYAIKPNISWAGLLCVITGVVCLLVGPQYKNGVIYYAIERSLQITFAMSAVIVTFILLRGQQSHKLLREKLVDVMGKCEGLWSMIAYDFSHASDTQAIQSVVRDISMDLLTMKNMLHFSRYEFWKKNFNAGQCLQLLQLIKRMLAMLVALNECVKYVKKREFSESIQAYINELELSVKSSFRYLADLISGVKKSYSTEVDQLERQASEDMNDRLMKYIHKYADTDEFDLSRIAWYSLIDRLYYVFSMMRKVIVLMNSNKVNLKLRAQLTEEMRWIQGEGAREGMLQPMRLKYSFHGALTAGIIVWMQQYFHWSPIVAMIGCICVVFLSVSIVLPMAGNFGLGLLGALLGIIYCYGAMSVLQYYPQYGLVLLFLFLGTVIGGYAITITKLQNRSLLIFAIYFVIVCVFVLTAVPTKRANFDIGVFIIIAILLSTVLYTVIRKWLLPIDYMGLMRRRLSLCLMDEAELLSTLSNENFSSKSLGKVLNKLFQMSERINQSRTAIQYCVEGELINTDQEASFYEVSYSSYLMLLATLSVVHPFMQLKEPQLINTLYGNLQRVFAGLVKNIDQHAKLVANPDASVELLESCSELKLQVDTEFNKAYQLVIDSPDGVKIIRALSIAYNSLHRLIDVQTRLLSAHQICSESNVKANAAL